jgi:hypothetical protein
MTPFTHNGHAPETSRIPPHQHARGEPRTPDAHHAHIARLMSSHGVQVWQALMRQNRERAKRRKEAV